MYEIFAKLLEEHGVTAYKVSKETGVGTATLTSWKQGKYQPKPDKMRKIAEYFGVTVEYLTTGKEQDKSSLDIMNDNIVFRSQLNRIGWTYTYVDLTEGLDCEKCIDQQSACWRENDTDEKPAFCDHCKKDDCYYEFTNGSVTFKVSVQDYDSFIVDGLNFYRERIQKLLTKSMINIFDDNSLPVAARNDHELDNEEIELQNQDIDDL